MVERPSALLALRSVATAAAVWVLVGVPCAGGIAALRASLWVILSFPLMAICAAVLGATQGLWFYLAAPRPKPEGDSLVWLGLFSGGFLGVLGFPPVFSRANIIAALPTAAVFLLAAIVGGVAAGLVSARVLATPLRGRSLALGWKVVFGSLIFLTALDYHFFWPETIERIAAPEVSSKEISNLAPGNARGSAWTGCYQYQGQLPLGTGGERGRLRVVQTDGVLKVQQWGEAHPLLGGVDRNGLFRFGAEISSGRSTYRVLWQGKFYANSFEFKRRMTVVGEPNNLGATQLTGTAQMATCYN